MTRVRHVIKCRAQLAEDCYHGSPTRRQFGENLPMSEDGTFSDREADAEGQFGTATIVCDACYSMLQPFTPSGSALEHELTTAIHHVRDEMGYLRAHRDPGKLAREAREYAAVVTGAPHDSALAAARLADREIKRRAAA